MQFSPFTSNAKGVPVGSIIEYGGVVDHYFWDGSGFGISNYNLSTIPKGYFPCLGNLLLRAEFPKLFTAIGTRHGTEGSTDFAVPDKRLVFSRGRLQNATGGPGAGVIALGTISNPGGTGKRVDLTFYSETGSASVPVGARLYVASSTIVGLASGTRVYKSINAGQYSTSRSGAITGASTISLAGSTVGQTAQFYLWEATANVAAQYRLGADADSFNNFDVDRDANYAPAATTSITGGIATNLSPQSIGFDYLIRIK